MEKSAEENRAGQGSLYWREFKERIRVAAKADMILEQTECVAMLIARAGELGRLPKKSDMVEEHMWRIKRSLGPWPRALEKAGLKPASNKPSKWKRKRMRKAERKKNQMSASS